MQETFKGIRNDIGEKHISQEFVYDATNVNNDSIVGIDSILYPERSNLTGFNSIDGLYEYRYLDSSLQSQTENITISGGDIGVGESYGASKYFPAGTVSHMTSSGTDIQILDVQSGPGGIALFNTGAISSANVVVTSTQSAYNDIFWPVSFNAQYFKMTPKRTDFQTFPYVPGPAISYVSNATGYINYAQSPTNITTTMAHMMQTGDYITITGTINYNGLFMITVIDDYTFSIPTTFVLNESSSIVISKDIKCSSLTAGLCQFTTFNDKLLIVNGKDYPLWYNGSTGNFYQMNAPEANQGSVGGVLNGTYTYAISFTTTAGDDIFGTVSNAITVNGRKVKLTLPIPYAAATAGMKLYRTIAGGTQLKLLHTFTAPTPLTYEDNDPDSALGANIGVTNNEMIKPYFVESLFDCICMSVVDKYPTQCFIGEAGLEVLDPASNFIDLANVASDNTPIVGMEVDYNQLVLGTHRNVILVDPSTSPASVTFTRSNIGVLNGYSMCRVPANGNFDGGVMFVSTLGDVRLVSGYKNVIPNTVNDISTENMAQVIQGTFPGMVKSASNINSIFYDYKYHLIVGEIMWVFDIRTESWWKYDVRTTNYVSLPTCFGISGGVLYNGQTDGWIERMYSTIDYNGEDVVSTIESGTLTVNDAYKFMNNWQFWLYTSPNTELTIQMILDDDIQNAIEATFSVGEGYFSPKTFSHIFYDTGISTEDYRNFNVSRVARWVKFIITCNKGRLYFRGYNPGVELLRNKE